MRISDWSSDVCSSDLPPVLRPMFQGQRLGPPASLYQSVPDQSVPGPRPVRHCPVAQSMRSRRLYHQIGLALPGTYARFRLPQRSEENTSELQSLMRISYSVTCLTTKIDTIDVTKEQS